MWNFSFYTIRILTFVSRYALGKTSEINLIGIVGFNTLAEENQENIKSHSERKWRYLAGSENRPLNPTHRYQVIEVVKKLFFESYNKLKNNLSLQSIFLTFVKLYVVGRDSGVHFSSGFNLHFFVWSWIWVISVNNVIVKRFSKILISQERHIRISIYENCSYYKVHLKL